MRALPQFSSLPTVWAPGADFELSPCSYPACALRTAHGAPDRVQLVSESFLPARSRGSTPCRPGLLRFARPVIRSSWVDYSCLASVSLCQLHYSHVDYPPRTGSTGAADVGTSEAFAYFSQTHGLGVCSPYSAVFVFPLRLHGVGDPWFCPNGPARFSSTRQGWHVADQPRWFCLQRFSSGPRQGLCCPLSGFPPMRASSAS